MMRHVLKVLCALIFAGMFLSGESVRADDVSMTSVINKAGYQRMLSQRIVKLYCQIGLGVMPEASSAQLLEAIKTYEKNLQDVRRHVNDAGSQKSIDNISRQWEAVKAVVVVSPARSEAEVLIVRSEALLKAAENLTEHLQNISGDPSLGLVNLSGRQRMLSQRLAKDYMLREWGVNPALIHDAIDVARKEFSAALGELLKSPEDSPEVQAELDVVRLQWDLFQAALVRAGDALNHQVVVDTSESILNHMDHVTQLYVELAQR